MLGLHANTSMILSYHFHKMPVSVHERFNTLLHNRFCLRQVCPDTWSDINILELVEVNRLFHRLNGLGAFWLNISLFFLHLIYLFIFLFLHPNQASPLFPVPLYFPHSFLYCFSSDTGKNPINSSQPLNTKLH